MSSGSQSTINTLSDNPHSAVLCSEIYLAVAYNHDIWLTDLTSNINTERVEGEKKRAKKKSDLKYLSPLRFTWQ